MLGGETLISCALQERQLEGQLDVVLMELYRLASPFYPTVFISMPDVEGKVCLLASVSLDYWGGGLALKILLFRDDGVLFLKASWVRLFLLEIEVLPPLL